MPAFRVPSCALAAALALCVGAARASTFDVLGFGPAGVAEVNARAARADDGTASFYNPGGLGLGSGYRVELSWQLGISSLEVQGQTRDLDAPFGVAIAFDATVPFEGPLADRVRVGFGGYFLPDAALRLITRRGDEPFFPYYDNRTQRLIAIPTLAVKILPNLAVGAGMNLLAGVSGPADVRPGASGALESRIDEEATTVAAANVGLRFDPAPGVRLALVYRQRFAVQTDVRTTAEVGGVPLRVDVDARQALYDPDTFVLGTSFDLGRATVELDASYALWSSYDGPFLLLDAELPGVAISTEVPEGLFRDVVGVRGAFDYRFAVGGRSDLVLRLGAGLETSMLNGSRQGRTNLVDGHKLLFGTGATVVLRDVLPKVLFIGLGANAQVVGDYTQDKVACVAQPCPASTVVGPNGADPSANIDNPGYPTLSGSGVFWATSLGVGVEL